MAEKPDRNTRFLTWRNTLLFSLASILIVFTGWILIAAQLATAGADMNLWQFHGRFPALIIFDALPVYVFLVLWLAKRRYDAMSRKVHADLEKKNTILKQNTRYARLLSEGEDPDAFGDMLDTELGQVLKLIQLNIKSNRRKENDITWITEGKDMISRILRVYNDIDTLSYQILVSLSKYIHAIQGAVYLYDEEKASLHNIALLAYNRRKYLNQEFAMGEGLVGQCAYEMDYIYRTEIPDDYVTITSGILGDQKPRSIVLVPLITNEKLEGVMEFAFFDKRIPKLTIQFLLELGEIIARTIYNLRINEQTRLLLEESREMTEELRKNEAVMQENARVMETTQEQLKKANEELQQKIEEARYAQERLHWLLQNASEIISIYDESIRLTYISPSAEHILGYTVEEMMNGKDFERIDQEGSKAIRKAFGQLLEQPDEILHIEYTYTRRDGTRLYLRSSIRNLLDDKAVNGFIFNTRDITESRRVEREQRLKTRMQSLSENSLDLIMRLSPEGFIYYVNPVVEDYAGITAEKMLNRNIEDMEFEKDLAAILSDTLHQVNTSPGRLKKQVTITIPVGEAFKERILTLDVIPEFENNQLETILLVGHDITEAKKIEAEIRITNRKIQDSINYAERIQSSILPEAAQFRRAFPRSFLYYLPRDVISGDFPWFMEDASSWYYAAVDCTGHGVPGALLSFIGHFLLNNVTAVNPGVQAGELLDMLDAEVRKALKQDKENPETRDGMDLALVKVSKNSNRLEFAGAHRPMYILREGELTVFKGDRKAIGGQLNPRKPAKPFTTHGFDFRKGDKLFVFSDGLTDQLGGEKGVEKYSPARVRNILLENPGYTLQQFRDFFAEDFRKWTGEEKQLDDVLMIGVEL